MQDAAVDPAWLGSLVPIKALSPEHREELAQKSRLVTAAPGTVLFKAGDPVEAIAYLREGRVELREDGGAPRLVAGGTRAATLPLEQGETHRFTARALTPVKYLLVDPNMLDIMLTWEQSGGYEVQEIGSGEAGEDDWMARILQARVFHSVPAANIQSVFMKMGTAHFKAGETVIRQGDEGDTFYIVREGRCRVVRRTKRRPEGVVLAELGVGDHFGEDALISGGRRNASVVMLPDGVLMPLGKADFLELLNEPVLQRVEYAEVRDAADIIWIDVRLPQEHQARALRGSINIPLPVLREKVARLARDRRYVVYCDTGRRSSAAAYLMRQAGLDAAVLAGGLKRVDPDRLTG